MNEKTNHLISLISIVDDDQSIREATTSLLKSNGFRTEVFSSAEEFLGSPHWQETKCLILDIQMPRMTGLELQRRLTAENRRIPIIFITAHGDQKTRDEALRAGAIDFLTKPFSEEALLHAIKSALQPANQANDKTDQVGPAAS
jgi:FixJ family two-component response regulator